MKKHIQLSKLLVTRQLLEDPIMIKLQRFLSDDMHIPYAQEECIAHLIAAGEQLGLSGNLLSHYLIYALTHTPNIVSETIDRTGMFPGDSLYNAFCHDISLLYPLLSEPSSTFLSAAFLDDYLPTKIIYNKVQDSFMDQLKAVKSSKAYAKELLAFYMRYGYGDLATYAAFRWNDDKNNICGIQHFEQIQMNDLIGYERQKEQIIQNTLAFVSDKPANHVLLVGARGTGKSSAVKALISMFEDSRLRLLQITKRQLQKLPDIMDMLRHHINRKFIIFLDDLSFEDSDAAFKEVKSAIEGGVSSCPPNVCIYATSNRRHLVRETWHDREQDELYHDDSANETISLSDRFGLIIHYHTPNQSEYLAIIDHLLRQNGIELTPEELHIAGLRWEMTHSGRSGRTAKQFAAHYLGNH